MSSPDLAQLIAKVAREHIYHSAAASTLLLFDLIGHLDEEVQLVWRSGNTLPKYLYFISRYYGVLGQLVITSNVFPMFCFSYILMSLMLLLPVLLSVELSLMLRVDALYAKNQSIRVVMMCGLVAEIAIALAFEIGSFPRVRQGETSFPAFIPTRGCLSDVAEQPVSFRLTWIPVVAFDTLLFVLNTVKCISYGPLNGTPIIYRLFRDGSAYYVIIFVCILLCTLTQFLAILYASIAVTWLTTVLSYSGCHLLLRIRRAAARREATELMISANMPEFEIVGRSALVDTSLSSGSADHTPEERPRSPDVHHRYPPAPSQYPPQPDADIESCSYPCPCPCPHPNPPQTHPTLAADAIELAPRRASLPLNLNLDLDLGPRPYPHSPATSHAHSHSYSCSYGEESSSGESADRDWADRCRREWDFLTVAPGPTRAGVAASRTRLLPPPQPPPPSPLCQRPLQWSRDRGRERERENTLRVAPSERGEGEDRGSLWARPSRSEDSSSSATSGVRWLRRWRP